MKPEEAEAWLAQWPTWMLLFGAFLLLVAAVRVMNLLLDLIFPPLDDEDDRPLAPLETDEGEDPWRWN